MFDSFDFWSLCFLSDPFLFSPFSLFLFPFGFIFSDCFLLLYARVLKIYLFFYFFFLILLHVISTQCKDIHALVPVKFSVASLSCRLDSVSKFVVFIFFLFFLVAYVKLSVGLKWGSRLLAFFFFFQFLDSGSSNEGFSILFLMRFN
ncbi:hypothetical protein MANES_16G070650v8 [Manihot esculenta]|uniref:Uncharacterized protein n=1 Tax=Manihot esculenta TaxID=3983 RepID=A0ACB7G7B0_MANES|nr:hypothetical protein MANES_16G070650v8 [Manihot esculenta]